MLKYHQFNQRCICDRCEKTLKKRVQHAADYTMSDRSDVDGTATLEVQFEDFNRKLSQIKRQLKHSRRNCNQLKSALEESEERNQAMHQAMYEMSRPNKKPSRRDKVQLVYDWSRAPSAPPISMMHHHHSPAPVILNQQMPVVMSVEVNDLAHLSPKKGNRTANTYIHSNLADSQIEGAPDTRPPMVRKQSELDNVIHQMDQLMGDLSSSQVRNTPSLSFHPSPDYLYAPPQQSAPISNQPIQQRPASPEPGSPIVPAIAAIQSTPAHPAPLITEGLTETVSEYGSPRTDSEMQSTIMTIDDAGELDVVPIPMSSDLTPLRMVVSEPYLNYQCQFAKYDFRKNSRRPSTRNVTVNQNGINFGKSIGWANVISIKFGLCTETLAQNKFASRKGHSSFISVVTRNRTIDLEELKPKERYTLASAIISNLAKWDFKTGKPVVRAPNTRNWRAILEMDPMSPVMLTLGQFDRSLLV